jgi:uncharacterized protein (DUF302 family)
MVPVIELKNGVRVANFSSPHPFTFDSGETLPACSPERAKELMLESVEVAVPGIKGTTDIQLEFKISEAVKAALAELERDEGIDIVLVPFPVMQALKDAGLSIGKARVCRVADRVSKTIFSDKFCR